MNNDMINGAFEAVGAFMLMLNVRRLWRDKRVAGVHWGATVFFTVWGGWNLIYYPGLDQWFSFAGGALIAAANIAWLLSLVWITRGGRR